MTLPAVQPRPTPIRPIISTFADLQAYLDKRLASIESDLGDDEWCQHAGIRGQDRLTAYRTTLLDVAFEIRSAVADEAERREREAAEDRVDAAYKAAGFTGDPSLALAERADDGDR